MGHFLPVRVHRRDQAGQRCRRVEKFETRITNPGPRESGAELDGLRREQRERNLVVRNARSVVFDMVSHGVPVEVGVVAG